MRRRPGSLAAVLGAALLVVLVLACATVAAAAAPLDRTVARELARAGGVSGAFVLDTTTGRTLAAVRADAPRIPASVEKLSTTATALRRFGPDATLDTTVLGSGTLDDAGVWHGDLYLRGGGDPTLGSAAFTLRAYGAGATVAELAVQLQAAGIRRVTGSVFGDETVLDGLRGDPANGFGLDKVDLGGPLGGLLYNRGLAHERGSALQPHPATFAAERLAAELRRRHVRVAARGAERPAPAGAQQLALVASPPMATLVRLTLVPSDNLFAELLLKDLGARFGGGGSTTAGIAVVRQTLAGFGIRPAIADGSGLSRADRESPRQVVTLLRAMRGDVAFRAALPVAGRTGTLVHRMRRTAARDRCQAKTGTLSNVSALAGYCQTRNGHLIAFALMENGVWTPRAKRVEDRLTAALARTRPAMATPIPKPPSPAPGPGGGTPPPAS